MKTKNVAVIIVTVLVLIGVTYYADKVTRVSNKVGTTHAYSADKSIGLGAPDVHFKDLDGKDVSLWEYNGKVVLVNFWATWCDPCRVEIPWLIDMQQKYAGKGFTVLGVAMDEEGKSVVAPFVAKEQFDVGGGTKSTMS
jgi:thiol-disulfide isomerase/thioredoxin